MQDAFILGEHHIEQKLRNLTLQSENKVSGEKIYEDPETRTAWVLRTIHTQGKQEDFRVLARLNAPAAAELATILVNADDWKVKIAAAHYLADLDRNEAFTAIHRALRITYGSSGQADLEATSWEIIFQEMHSSLDNFLTFEGFSAEQKSWNKSIYNH